MENELLLKIEGLSKNFGGLAALSDVSLALPRGVIYGLIGPNGSGKTTLFNCISGVYRASAGKVVFRGEEIQALSAHVICRKGMGRTYQNVRPFASLSVYDNVRAGLEFSGKARSDHRPARELILETLSFVGLAGKESEIAAGLPLALRKRLEIGRALIGRPRLLLLDEVAAGLNLAESQEIIELVNRIHEQGVTILMVEHVMPIIMKVCHHIVVLSEGKKIAEGDPLTISRDKRVIESYLGEEALKEVDLDRPEE